MKKENNKQRLEIGLNIIDGQYFTLNQIRFRFNQKRKNALLVLQCLDRYEISHAKVTNKTWREKEIVKIKRSIKGKFTMLTSS